MSEWRMADIMAQSNCLDQIFIKLQEPANCSCNSGNKLDMKDPVGYVVVIDQAKYLGFVNISDISPGVEDTISVKCKLLAVTSSFLKMSPGTLITVGCPGGEVDFFISV